MIVVLCIDYRKRGRNSGSVLLNPVFVDDVVILEYELFDADKFKTFLLKSGYDLRENLAGDRTIVVE